MKSQIRSKLEAAQLRRLNQWVRAILPANRFYTQKLIGKSFRKKGNGVAAYRPFRDWEDFAGRVPFTTKAELMADQMAHPPFGTNHTFPLDQYTRFHQTSGTTGQPMRWLDTPASWNWMMVNWMEVYRAAGVRPRDRVFFAFSFGPFLGFWTAFEAATRLGCLCLPGGGQGSAVRLQAILDNGANVLCCTPTYALRLAEVAKQEKISLSRSVVKTILVAGESGGSIPSVREQISKAWNGARVFDHHGMTEVGPVTYEHPRRPCTLMVMENAYLAEIIDPKTTHEVAVGEIGELVLTPLAREMPLLRYRTGDLVKKILIAGQLGLDGGILGRADDMLIVRGVNVFPSAVEEILRSFSGVAEYRVEVRRDRAMTELAVVIEPKSGHRNARALAQKLESALRAAFSLRIPVSVAPGSLPRFEMKARRWVNCGV